MLTVHRAERADRLVDALASVFIDRLPDPFTPEVVAVLARGIERWLTQCLSTVLGTSPDRHDGVCGNIAASLRRSSAGHSPEFAFQSGSDRDALATRRPGRTPRSGTQTVAATLRRGVNDPTRRRLKHPVTQTMAESTSIAARRTSNS
jgi:exonuclease V gamma subunit